MNTIPRMNRLDCTLLATLARNRPLALSLAAAGTVQLGLTAAGFPGWTCPCVVALGIPCPGCGVSRAMLTLFVGDLHSALRIHAFAPVFAGVLALLLLMAVLGRRPRDRLAAILRSVEERTAIAPVVLGALVLYWVSRLALDGAAFAALVR